MTTRTIARLLRITGTCPGWWKQSFRLRSWSLVWFQVRATSCHLTSSKSAWKSTSKCTWVCWSEWWSPGAIRWLVADPGCGSRTVPAHKSKETQAWLQKECYDLVPFTHCPLLPHWTSSFGHTSRTSPTWPPTTPKPVWSPPSAELPPALVEKACSQFRTRIEAVIEAEGGYIEYMFALLHNQVTWTDFFNKILKIKL